jgi:hypothetical protein
MTAALPSDDRPPATTTEADLAMQRQLELLTSRHFFEACEGSIQSLLMECGWAIHTADVLILVIHCPDNVTNWRVLNRIAQIAEPLAQFSALAKIRVYPPMGKGGPFDVRVDERTVYQNGQPPYPP